VKRKKTIIKKIELACRLVFDPIVNLVVVDAAHDGH
jgi:hypothetical protein